MARLQLTLPVQRPKGTRLVRRSFVVMSSFLAVPGDEQKGSFSTILADTLRMRVRPRADHDYTFLHVILARYTEQFERENVYIKKCFAPESL